MEIIGKLYGIPSERGTCCPLGIKTFNLSELVDAFFSRTYDYRVRGVTLKREALELPWPQVQIAGKAYTLPSINRSNVRQVAELLPRIDVDKLPPKTSIDQTWSYISSNCMRTEEYNCDFKFTSGDCCILDAGHEGSHVVSAD